MTNPRIAAARAMADARRAALFATAHEVQERLGLSSLAEGAFATLKRKGEEAARKRPVAVGAAAAGVVALVFGAPLARLVGLTGKDRGKGPKHDGDEA